MANKSSKRKAENDRRIRKKLALTKHMAPKESPINHGPSAFMHDKKQAAKRLKEKEEQRLYAIYEAQRAAEAKEKVAQFESKQKSHYGKGKKPAAGNKSPR